MKSFKSGETVRCTLPEDHPHYLDGFLLVLTQTGNTLTMRRASGWLHTDDAEHYRLVQSPLETAEAEPPRSPAKPHDLPHSAPLEWRAEIIAWANGAEIQSKSAHAENYIDDHAPDWNDPALLFRVKTIDVMTTSEINAFMSKYGYALSKGMLGHLQDLVNHADSEIKNERF